MSTIMNKVSCLSCGWTSTDEEKINRANYFGECLGDCLEGSETLLRWDYESGEISVSHTGTGDSVCLEVTR